VIKTSSSFNPEFSSPALKLLTVPSETNICSKLFRNGIMLSEKQHLLSLLNRNEIVANKNVIVISHFIISTRL